MLIRVRNPWGKKEWTGRWSDNSREWTPFAKQALNYQGVANDGTFWMAYGDFCHQFTRMFICRLYNDAFGAQFYRYMLPGEWAGHSAGGCTNNLQLWKNNPMYGITARAKTLCTICVTQEDSRLLKGARDEYPIAFSVFSSKDNSKRIEAFTAASRVATTGVYEPTREVMVEQEFSPGQYIIVPTTFDPGCQAKFWVVVYSLTPLQMHEITSRGVIATQGNPMQSIDQALQNMHVAEQPAVYAPPAPHYDPYNQPGFDPNWASYDPWGSQAPPPQQAYQQPAYDPNYSAQYPPQQAYNDPNSYNPAFNTGYQAQQPPQAFSPTPGGYDPYGSQHPAGGYDPYGSQHGYYPPAPPY